MTESTKARICFIHIPKTAGSSLRRMLEGNYFESDVFDGRTMLGYEGKDRKDMEPYRLYLGHLFYYRALEILPDDVSYVTLLRDPVSRVKSLYYFWRGHSDDYINDLSIPEVIRKGPRLAKELSLIDFLNLDDAFVQHAISNSQVRQLWPEKAWNLGNNRVENLDALRDKLTSLLNDFAVVGVQELFPFFVYKINRRFINQGVFIDNIENMNRATKDSNNDWNNMVSSDKDMVIQTIMKKNTIDYQIYKWVYNRNILELNALVKSKLQNPFLYT